GQTGAGGLRRAWAQSAGDHSTWAPGIPLAVDATGVEKGVLASPEVRDIPPPHTLQRCSATGGLTTGAGVRSRVRPTIDGRTAVASPDRCRARVAAARLARRAPDRDSPDA